MADKVLMLALSPTMETGTIVNWTKKEGDAVSEGDVLCEVETDKATMEYESQNEGNLLKILVPAGSEAVVGQSIAVVGEAGEDISSLLSDIEKETAASPASGDSTGPAPEQIPPAAQETVSAKSPVPDTASPQAQAEETVSRQAHAEYTTKSAVSAVPTPGAQTGASAATPPGGIKASPVARRLADQHHIDIGRVSGSGPEGRVVKRDVEQAIAAGGTPPEPVAARPAPSSGPGIALPSYTPVEMTTTQVPVSGKRKVIAQRLSESKFSAPHYYLRTIVAVDGLFTARQELNRRTTEKVSFNAFLLKFVAEALRRHPKVNAGWQGDHILQFGRADIGLAVAQPDGLITPIVRDCWNRGILSIDAELKVLIDKALNNKLKPEEFTGATFTISNLGSYGIHDFTAVINPPGSAILAVGEARKEPVVGKDDQIDIQTNMVLSLSCDHRVVDGAVGALFMQNLRALMEDPIQVLY
jgi:pyruvate dehydrogenase E2 component (dihydrolipoamide acetyltransferase)